MSVYPRKSPSSRNSNYTKSIKPAFIEKKTNAANDSLEITAIQQLRQATHSLVNELWEAGRDNDPTASFAGPIPKAFIDPVRELKEASLSSKKGRRGYYSFGFSPTPSDQSIILKSADAPPFLSRKKSHSSMGRDREASISEPPSPTKTQQSFKRRVTEQHETIKLQLRSQNIAETLNRHDGFYRELQQFRRLYSKDFIRDEPPVPKAPPLPPSQVKRELLKEEKLTESQMLQPEFYTNGFFRVNDRLFPERVSRAFKKANDIELLSIGDMRNLAEDIPPVKVSIPFSKLSKTERTYVAHRRSSYDPSDSADIGAYLYKGNVAHVGARRKKAFRPVASIKDECRNAKKKAASKKL